MSEKEQSKQTASAKGETIDPRVKKYPQETCAPVAPTFSLTNSIGIGLSNCVQHWGDSELDRLAGAGDLPAPDVPNAKGKGGNSLA